MSIIHYHHHGRAPDWSIAVSASCFQRPLSWMCRRAEFRPWLSGWRSASRVRSQVWRGRPGRHLQSLGSPWIDVCKAWTGHASCPSVPHAQRSGAILFGWAATAVVESWLGDVHQHW